MKKQILFLLLVTASLAGYAQNTVKENRVLIGNERSHLISQAQLSSDPVLRMPAAESDYHITSYEVSYLPKGKDKDLEGPFKIKGDNMNTGNAADILSRAQPGDRIFFEEIVAVSNSAGRKPLKLTAAVRIR